MLSTNPNITWKQIQEFPIKNYKFISKNPNITLDIIKANPDCKWDYSAFSKNKSITLEQIITNPDIPWDYKALSQNNDITLEFMDEHKDKQWGIYNFLKYNKNRSLNIVYSCPITTWTWHIYEDPVIITEIPKFDINYINKALDGIDPLNIPILANSLENLESSNKEKIIYMIQQIHAGLQLNPNITLDMLKKANIELDNNFIRDNPNITFDDIIKYNIIPRENNLLTFNPYVYTRHIKNHITNSMFSIQAITHIIKKYISI